MKLKRKNNLKSIVYIGVVFVLFSSCRTLGQTIVKATIYQNNIFYLDTMDNSFYYSADYGSFKLSTLGKIKAINDSLLVFEANRVTWMKNYECSGKKKFFLEMSDTVIIDEPNNINFYYRNNNEYSWLLDSLQTSFGKKYEYSIEHNDSVIYPLLKGVVYSIDVDSLGLYSIDVIHGNTMSRINGLSEVTVRKCQIVSNKNKIGVGSKDKIQYSFFVIRNSINMEEISRLSYSAGPFKLEYCDLKD